MGIQIPGQEEDESMKYALVGCGMISKNHIESALVADLEIMALCDVVMSNAEKALEYIPEEKRANVKLYSDYQKMLLEEKPELVALALGSGLKKRFSIECMRAGANVIVEKPISLSLEDADEMIAISKECGVRLCVCHQLRFVPTARCIKAAKEHGDFGKLLHGTVQIRRNRNKAYYDAAKWRGTWAQDGGTLMNQCIHYTDLLTWFMGKPEEVFAYTDNLAHPYTEAEDMGLALVKFKNGSYGMIEGTVNTYPNNLSDSIAVFGTEGAVSLSGKYLDDIERWNFANAPDNPEEAMKHYGVSDMGTGHTPFYRDVVNAIEKNLPLSVSAEDARASVELVLAIYQSAATGLPVKLPLTRGSTLDFPGRFDRKGE